MSTQKEEIAHSCARYVAKHAQNMHKLKGFWTARNRTAEALRLQKRKRSHRASWFRMDACSPGAAQPQHSRRSGDEFLTLYQIAIDIGQQIHVTPSTAPTLHGSTPEDSTCKGATADLIP